MVLDTEPEVRTLVLSMYPDASSVHAALSAGAAGYATKLAARPELVPAIQAVAAGERYVDPSLQP